MPDVRWSLVAIAAVSFATHAAPPRAAPPQVVEAGPTVPTSPYWGQLIAGEDQEGVMEGQKFPIRTKLKPGRLLGPVKVLDDRWMTQPILILGDDPASVTVLTQHNKALHDMGVTALVLSAKTPQTFKVVQRAAQAVAVAPGPDSWLEQLLVSKGVTVYPVLIRLDGMAVAP